MTSSMSPELLAACNKVETSEAIPLVESLTRGRHALVFLRHLG